MTSLLLKIFVKDYKETKNPDVREKYGTLSGIVGIALNILLCIGKFIIGSMSGSIAVTADAFNNLSDAGSSVVTVFGFKLSSKKADKDHPFGHGRYEYIAALVVAFFVVITGIDLVKSAVGKIMNPTGVQFGIPALIVLVMSIGGKIWLALFNRKLGKAISSPAMSAVVTDSMGDIIATSASLISLIVSKFTSVNVDGYMGIIVALFVLYAGYGIIKDTVGPLLGEPPSGEIVKELTETVMSFDHVMGIHDLVLHNYGANVIFGSLHLEVSAKEDFVEMHDLADRIEQYVYEKMKINLVVHLDPLVFDDERINSFRVVTENAVSEICEGATIHDFRVVDGPTHTNLVFDAVIPHGSFASKTDFKKQVAERIRKKYPDCYAVITVENSYI